MVCDVYYIKGENFDVQGVGTTVIGSNVMIYLTVHPGQSYVQTGLKVGSTAIFDVQGRTGANDPYRGITIFVDRSIPNQTADVTFESASTLKLSGAIYAPNQITRIHSETVGESTAGGGLAIISDVVEVTSSNTGLYVDNDFAAFGGPLFREALFLE